MPRQAFANQTTLGHSENPPMDRQRYAEFQQAQRELIAKARFGEEAAAGASVAAAQDQTLVSIVVVNYNGERVLRRCLQSLRALSHQQIEILVIDNGSTDASRSIVAEFSADSRLRLVEVGQNLGISRGRNLGLEQARGEVIAFIDNDGYAHPDWLSYALAEFRADPHIGAVAPLVFFAGNQLVLNGAGGSSNLRGYAGDRCFNQPFEFAEIEKFALYPMGCGMILRTSVMRELAPLDRHQKWYDDTETGQRVWHLGYRVVVARRSWVDHEYSTTDKALPIPNWKRAWLFERARVRHSLKYLPPQTLRVWLREELLAFGSELRRGHLRYAALFALVWGFNVRHVRSLLEIRRRFQTGTTPPAAVYRQSRRPFPAPSPDNRVFLPTLDRLPTRIEIDGSSELACLHWGWWEPRKHGGQFVRPTAEYASAWISVSAPTEFLLINCLPPSAPYRGVVIVRRLGELNPVVELELSIGEAGKQLIRLPVHLASGSYELILQNDSLVTDRDERAEGLMIASIEFS